MPGEPQAISPFATVCRDSTTDTKLGIFHWHAAMYIALTSGREQFRRRGMVEKELTGDWRTKPVLRLSDGGERPFDSFNSPGKAGIGHDCGL